MLTLLTSAVERAEANGSSERSIYLRERVGYELGDYEERMGERDLDLGELEGRLGRVERGLRRGWLLREVES